MRQVVFVATTLSLLACGPDPNARLPGWSVTPSQGGSGSGGFSGGSGGATSASGGAPSSGGNPSPFASGGSASSGGASSAGGSPLGGSGSGGFRAGTGGAGAGGTTVSAAGGSNSAGGAVANTSKGELASYSFGASTEPCAPAKDVSGGQSGNFKTTGAFCFRTADDFTNYGCSSVDGRTLKINGTPVTKCGGTAPAKLGSFYYFDFGPGTYDYSAVNWYCSDQSCLGPHPVPVCGHYPPWQAGGTAAPCADSTSATPDAAATTD